MAVFTVFIITGTAFCQTVNSSCTAPDSIIKKYAKDAVRLSVIREFKINDTYKDSAHINPQIRQSYLNALIAVYNATALPARDTVVSLLNIHRTLEHVDQIEFLADSTLPWIFNLKNNVSPTGNSGFDNWLTKYSLQKQSIIPTIWGNAVDIVLETDSAYNMAVANCELSLILVQIPAQ